MLILIQIVDILNIIIGNSFLLVLFRNFVYGKSIFKFNRDI